MKKRCFKVEYHKTICKCGHVLNFLSNHSARCTHCGRNVYPSKRCEFKDMLRKELKKK